LWFSSVLPDECWDINFKLATAACFLILASSYYISFHSKLYNPAVNTASWNSLRIYCVCQLFSFWCYM